MSRVNSNSASSILVVITVSLSLFGCSHAFIGSVSTTETAAQVETASDPSKSNQRSAPEWISTGNLREHGRPENAYTITALSIDPDEQNVCQQVFASLSKPRPPQPTFELADSTFGYTDALLGNDYSVEWTYLERDASSRYSKKGKGNSRAVVDIDNDGDQDTVYRFTRLRRAALFTSLIGYQGPPPDVEPPFNLSRADEIRRTHENDISKASGGISSTGIYLNQNSIPKGQRVQVENDFSVGQFLDVLKIDSTYYILRGGSVDTGISWHPVPIRLYRASSYREHKLLCEFGAISPLP